MRPKLTFFGNAPSEYLAYDAWNKRDLDYITNNQAGCMVVEVGDDSMPVYVTNEKFARSRNASTYYSEPHRAWFLQIIE